MLLLLLRACVCACALACVCVRARVLACVRVWVSGCGSVCAPAPARVGTRVGWVVGWVGGIDGYTRTLYWCLRSKSQRTGGCCCQLLSRYSRTAESPSPGPLRCALGPRRWLSTLKCMCMRDGHGVQSLACAFGSGVTARIEWRDGHHECAGSIFHPSHGLAEPPSPTCEPTVRRLRLPPSAAAAAAARAALDASAH